MNNIIKNLDYSELRSWLSLIASLLSFLVAFYTLLHNRKYLDVSIEDEYSVANEIYRNDEAMLSKKPSYVIPEGYIGIIIFVKVVNPSPNDIAFFDLAIRNKQTNQLVNQVVKGNLGIKPNENEFSYAGYNNSCFQRLNLIDSNYGIFKANNFKRLELVAVIPQSCKEISVSFKIAKTSILKNKNASVRKHFKYYSHDFSIDPNANCSTTSILGVEWDHNIKY